MVLSPATLGVGWRDGFSISRICRFGDFSGATFAALTYGLLTGYKNNWKKNIKVL
jgi:hypothetical protein